MALTARIIRLIAGLLAGCSLFAAGVPVSAQSGPSEDVELEADQLTYDAETGEVRALGRVQLVRQGYRLLAGEIRYNERTGAAVAVGAVEMVTPTGERIFAPRIELNEQLRTAFIEDFRLLLADGSQLAAASGEHDDGEGRSTLNKAVYSPCEVCKDDPNASPIWQIKAVRVTHDRNKKRLYYKNASLEVFGVPILWAPYFSHPDSTIDKATGFLPLQFKRRNELGVMVSVPYYHVIDDTQDFTITPTLTSREGAVLAGEYRKHFKDARLEVDGSITWSDTVLIDQPPGLPPIFIETGDREVRGHVRGSGYIIHDENWRSSFSGAWTSDDTYMRRYDFSDLDTLVSEYKLEGFFDRSYISARTIGFQGLRREDITGLTGHALPLIDAEYVSDFKPLGGTIRVRGNAMSIFRTNGLDTQRLSLSATWDRRWITPKGFVVDAGALVRSDYYNTSDLDRPDDPAFGGTVDRDARFLTRFSTRVAWPLVRTGKTGTHTLEPVVELVVSPERGAIEDLVNEDSRAFELNELNLFGAERAPGYDLWEEGSRITYGLNWRYDGADITTDMLFGQSVRITGDANQFPTGTGLEGVTSDFVGHTRIQYKNWLDFEHRYRLSDEDLAVRRNEIALGVTRQGWGVTANYLFLDRELAQGVNEFINREDREEVQLSAYLNLTDHWRISGLTIQNLTDGRATIQYGGELMYRDECLELAVEVRENFTIDRDFDPGTAILFRIKLRNLG